MSMSPSDSDYPRTEYNVAALRPTTAAAGDGLQWVVRNGYAHFFWTPIMLLNERFSRNNLREPQKPKGTHPTATKTTLHDHDKPPTNTSKHRPQKHKN